MKWKNLLAVIGIAALGLAMVPEVQAQVAPFDFTLSSSITTSSNSTTTISNATVMPVRPDKDLMIAISAHALSGTITGTATCGVDVVYGPTANQRTTTQPLQFVLTLNNLTNVTQTFWVPRTNFYGASGLAVSKWGSLTNTYVYLDEVSGNFWP